MNQLERVQRLIDKITYKPGWILSVSQTCSFERIGYGSSDRVTVSVKCWQIDTVTGQQIPLMMERSFDWYSLKDMKDEHIIEHCLCGLIRSMEMHEMDEWLKFDGVHVREPHPERKGRTAA